MTYRPRILAEYTATRDRLTQRSRSMGRTATSVSPLLRTTVTVTSLPMRRSSSMRNKIVDAGYGLAVEAHDEIARLSGRRCRPGCPAATSRMRTRALPASAPPDRRCAPAAASARRRCRSARGARARAPGSASGRAAPCSTATEKQMPCAPMITAVLMPITSPAELTSGPAGVARIERGVGLDHVADQAAVLGPQRAADGADDAGGDGRLEAERVADGDGDLARRARSWNWRGVPPARSRASRRAARQGRCRGRGPAARAPNLRPSDSDTVISLAPSMTWLLVRISPSGETTTPEPVPSAAAPVAHAGDRTCTTDGATVSTTSTTARE